MAAPAPRAFTAAAAGLSATSPASTEVDDMVICVTWERAGAGIPTHTVQTGSGFVEIRTGPHDDGSTDGRLSVAYKIATSAGANSYQAYTSSVGTETWTGIVVLKKGTFDATVGNMKTASATHTTNAAPNPPSVTLAAGKDWIIFALAGWHLTASQDNAVTPPSGYLEGFEVAGAATGDVSLAYNTFQDTITLAQDPGAFTDTQAPNGSQSMTIAIPSPVPSDGVWVGKIDAQSAGAGNTVTLTVPAAGVAEGDLIIIGGGRSFATAEGSIASIADTQGNTYTVDEVESTGSAFCASIASCVVGAGKALVSGNTIVVTFNGTGAVLAACAHVFTAPDGWESPPLDLTADAGGTSTTPSSGATGTTSQADELVVGGFSWAVANSWFEKGSGYTSLSGVQGSGDRKVDIEYKVVSGTGAQTADGTLNVSTQWNAIVATYKMAAAGAPQVHGTAALSSAAALVAAGDRLVHGVTAPSSPDALVATGHRTVHGSAALSSSAAAVVAGDRTVHGSAALASSDSLVAAGTHTVSGVATLASSDALVSTGKRTVHGSAALSATSDLLAFGEVVGSVHGVAALSSNDSLVSTGHRTVHGSSSLTSPASLVSSAKRTVHSAGIFSLVGLLSALGGVVLAPPRVVRGRVPGSKALPYSPVAATSSGFSWPMVSTEGQDVVAISKRSTQVPNETFITDENGVEWLVVDRGVVEAI